MLDYDPKLVQVHSSDEGNAPSVDAFPESHDSPPQSFDLQPAKPPALKPIAPSPAPKPKPKRLAGRSFVNDIGHGKNNRKRGVYDPGACSDGKQEHVLVESFVELLSATERELGAKVRVTEDMPLGARKADRSADATSWHMNAAVSHKATGVEVWIPLLASRASAAKSTRIGKEIADVLDLPYRGTKRTTALGVLNRGFDRLVELAFITNDTDRERFIKRAVPLVVGIVNQL